MKLDEVRINEKADIDEIKNIRSGVINVSLLYT
jgi:hypothetical protein